MMNLLILLQDFADQQLAVAPLAIAAIAMAAHKARVSYQQSRKAKQLEKGLTRPYYKTPEEIRQNLINAQRKRARASLFGMPGQGQIQNNIEGNVAAGNATALQTGQDPAAIMATINANVAAGANATEQLGVDVVNYQAAAIDSADAGVTNALQLVAGGKDKEFAYNQDDPYKARVAAIGALKEASIRNQDEALSTGLKGMGSGGDNNRMPNDTGTTPAVGTLQTDLPVNQRGFAGNGATGSSPAWNGGSPPQTGWNNGGYETQRPLGQTIDPNEGYIDVLQKQHTGWSRDQVKAFYGIK